MRRLTGQRREGKALVAALAVATAAASAGDFVNFESSHVHPIALSPGGNRLYAVNTPEARLAIFRVRGNGSLRLVRDVRVGLEPVSLAVRPGSDEVWVANHLSDTVSIVDARRRRLVATLHVGDEPTDVAFASGRAFVTLSGVDDAVRVYDAESREPIAMLPLFGEDPRALAASPDGSEVYAVALLSGNGTTSLHPVATGGPLPPPDPPRDPGLGPAPLTSLIIQFDPASGSWIDDSGGDRSHVADFDLPDEDLFVIDAAAPVPRLRGAVWGIGTLLFDVVARPGSDELWVPNTEARNRVRFEPNLRGHLVETRVTVVRPAEDAVRFIDLNSHVDYRISPGPPEEVERSLSQPGAGVFDASGARYYLSAFGSDRVAEIDAATGAVTRRFRVGGGPSGVALHERARRLYALNRFDNTISIVDLDAGAEVGVMGVAGPARFDPSPESVAQGRRFLYDAELSSGHGDVACASCHVGGDRDGLAWDLGDPQGAFVTYAEADWVTRGPGIRQSRLGFDPMKGPMTTQTLRGLRGMEPFHWRGDRRDFQHFNGAFDSLLGRGAPLSEAEMEAFADFAMTIALPPNPHRTAADGLPPAIAVPDPERPGEVAFGDPAAGAELFAARCPSCHALPAGTTNTVHSGAFRSDDFKVPHLRNVYEKLGRDELRVPEQGDRLEMKGGFGLQNDGTITLRDQLGGFFFDRQDQLDATAFVLAFATGTPACVGRQLTVDADRRGAPAVADAFAELVAVADAGACDLVAAGVRAAEPVGYVYAPAASAFVPDSRSEPPIGAEALLASIERSDRLTFTAVPEGSGRRLGVDRDRDGCLDRDERRQGTDPANPGVASGEWTPPPGTAPRSARARGGARGRSVLCAD